MLNTSIAPVPELHTPRLLLRAMTDADSEALFAMRSDPGIMRYIPRPLAVTVDDATEHIRMVQNLTARGEAYNWAVTLKSDPRMIGNIGFFRLQPENDRGEVGYILHGDYHGKGIISEALEAVLRFGFSQVGFHSVMAVVDPRNVASARVLERCGFAKEGHLRENCFWEGVYLDSVYYGLLRREFDKQTG